MAKENLTPVLIGAGAVVAAGIVAYAVFRPKELPAKPASGSLPPTEEGPPAPKQLPPKADDVPAPQSAPQQGPPALPPQASVQYAGPPPSVPVSRNGGSSGLLDGLVQAAPLLALAPGLFDSYRRNRRPSRPRTVEVVADPPLPNVWEGRLIQGTGTYPVYKIEGGKRRWVPNQEALALLGGAKAIYFVPAEFVSQFPLGPDMPDPNNPKGGTGPGNPNTWYEGMLVSPVGTTKIWHIVGGLKRLITAELAAKKYPHMVISSTLLLKDIDFYPDGPPETV